MQIYYFSADEHETIYVQERQCACTVTWTARSRNHCSRGKATNITYSERVSVALVISMKSACAVIYCHLWPVWLCSIFSTLSHKRDDFRKQNIIEHKMCSDFIYDIYLKHFSF